MHVNYMKLAYGNLFLKLYLTAAELIFAMCNPTHPRDYSDQPVLNVSCPLNQIDAKLGQTRQNGGFRDLLPALGLLTTGLVAL